MTPELEEANPAEPLKLEAKLDIYGAERLRDALMQQVAGNNPAIDLSAVEECSLVALQLLCSAVKSARAADKTLWVLKASPVVYDACTAAGIAVEDLNLPREARED